VACGALKVDGNSGEVRFASCEATGAGGAVYANSNTTSTMAGNVGTIAFEGCGTTSSGSGGAIWVKRYLTAERNTGAISFSGCSAKGSGGAVYLNDASGDSYYLTATSEGEGTLSFSDCQATGEGGAVYPRLVISGEGAGILIGHHGETLDAIQYLVNLSALRRGGNTQKEFVKIVVDIENYREKREETLRSLARRTAAKAQKYKKNVLLEPMNPYERRIIHSELQGVENISIHSVGSDENRKIVVTYEGADKVERRPRRGARRRQQETAPEAEEE
jgi:predicted outer membrane repeat protein